MRRWLRVMSGSAIVKVTAILSLTAICITALMHGVNSGLTATISAIIGGVAGYEVGRGSKSVESKLSGWFRR